MLGDCSFDVCFIHVDDAVSVGFEYVHFDILMVGVGTDVDNFRFLVFQGFLIWMLCADSF